MGGFFARQFAESDNNLNYGKRVKIFKEISHFISENNFTSKTPQNKIIKHTAADITILNHIIVKCMDTKGYSEKTSQAQIAKATGLHEKYVCIVIKRLEEAGFIYKTQRYRKKPSENVYYKPNGQREIVKCEKTLRHKLGYHLTPNILNRIYTAIKNKLKFLAPTDLTQKVKTILFTRTEIIRHFFSGKKTIEINPVYEALMKKQRREEAEKQLYKEKQFAKTYNKPEHEKSPLDKVLSYGLELFKKTKMQPPTPT